MAKKDDLYLDESIFGATSSGEIEYLELSLHRQIFLVMSGLAIFLFLVAFLRVAHLNVLYGDFYQARALSNVNRETILPGERGVILDRFNVPMVKNEATFSLFLNSKYFLKKSIDEQEVLIKNIESILGFTSSGEDIRTVLSKADLEVSPRIVIERGIDANTVIEIKGLNDLSLDVENDYRRDYLYGPIVAHVLGYTGVGRLDRTLEGKDGLEAYYNSFLRGQDGKFVVGRDARGNALFERVEDEPISGAVLYTAIDIEFQKYFYNRMQSGLKALGRDSGVGIALNPQTGEVLSMVSLPSFDSNLFTLNKRNVEKTALLSSSRKPLFNRAISGVYSPGSTFKPFLALVALHEKIMDPIFSVLSLGFIELVNPYDSAHPSKFLDWKAHGWVNLYSALARSSNIYFYTIGGGFQNTKGLGVARIEEYWDKFAFDEKTNIDLLGEAKGFFYGPREREERTGRIWRIGDTYNVSIGQGDLGMTPLKLINFIGAIGTGGAMKQPHVMIKIEDIAGNTIMKFLPKDILDFSYLAPEILEVQKGLRATVSSKDGTAYSMNDLPMTVSGKTGSAQILSNTKVNAFFVGYAPSENPQIAILVLVEDAREGSINTVPIAKDVLRWHYEHRIVKPIANSQ